MNGIQMIALWGVGSMLSALVGGILAYRKRRDHSAWAAWCFVFWPLLLVLVLLGRNPGARPRQPTLDDDDQALDHA